MKKIILFYFLFSCFVASSFAAEKKQETRYVNVQNAEVKEKSSSFSKVLIVLNYADSVSLIEDNGKWAKISINGQQGFINSSSLTKRKIRSSGFSASASELSLAGKGFNEEIEKSYKKSSNTDFTEVDKMETIIIDDKKLLRFIYGGKLNDGQEE